MPTLNDRFTTLSHTPQRNTISHGKTKRKRIHSSPSFDDYGDVSYDDDDDPIDDYGHRGRDYEHRDHVYKRRDRDYEHRGRDNQRHNRYHDDRDRRHRSRDYHGREHRGRDHRDRDYNNHTDDHDDHSDDYDVESDTYDNVSEDNHDVDDFRDYSPPRHSRNPTFSRNQYGRLPKAHKTFKVVPRRKPNQLAPSAQSTHRLTVKKRGGPTVVRRNQDTQRTKSVVKRRANTVVKKRNKPVVTLPGDDAYQGGRGRRKGKGKKKGRNQTYLDKKSRLIMKDDLDKELDDYYGADSSEQRKNSNLDLASAGQPIVR